MRLGIRKGVKGAVRTQYPSTDLAAQSRRGKAALEGGLEPDASLPAEVFSSIVAWGGCIVLGARDNLVRCHTLNYI